ncbi:MAG TPA: cohesin domain-containing protein [Terriglobales bacterium]|nr:cohesin domain-containing protein [Terriglobales bacterium]
MKGCLGLGSAPTPTITVTSPNGGENWIVGSSHNITWTTSNYNANVKIEYSTNAGSTWSTVIASTSNTGTYSWTIPNAPTTQARARVSDAATGTPTDMSDANFSISATPTITMTSPNGGENWCAGSSHNITWTYTGSITNVKLEYSTDNGSSWTTILASTPNDGSESWLIPNTPSTTSLVRVSDASSGIPSDVSNATFTIAPQVITITSPNGGETWQAGSSHNITWTSSCFSGNVKLEYSTDAGSSWITIIASTSNSGTYSWSVPNTPSTNSLVRVSDADDGVPNDLSNAIFTISPPPQAMLQVTSPNGGEIWFTGSLHNITWTSQGLISNVKIEYSIDAGADWSLITASTANTGTYPWTVPDTPSESALVRISDASNSEVTDISNALFTIKKAIVSGCKILFDISHGFASVPEAIDTTYWSHLISTLRSAGHTVVTDQPNFNLSGYNVVFLSVPGKDYTAGELSTLQSFVLNGGSVVISAEHSGGFGSTYLNHVANLFGINFKSNVVLDDNHNDQDNNNWPFITNYVAHPTTAGIKTTVIYAGSSLELSGSAYPIAYADTDAYLMPPVKAVPPTNALYAGKFQRLPAPLVDESGENITTSPSIVVMAASEYGNGKVWAVGDFNIWADDYANANIGIDYYDNQQLALNVFDWSCTTKPGAAVVVSMPDTCVKLGEFILVPVNVSNVTDKGVYSAEITLSFDKSILKATDATLLGTIAEGRLMFFNKYDDSIRIAISGTSPLSGSGPLVYVGFNVLSLPKDSTIIHFDRMRFNEGIPSVVTKDAVIKPCEVFQISGVIRYCLNNNPVDAALVRITDGKTDSVLTDASGGYSFLNLTGGMDYMTRPDKSDDAAGAITAYDASLILRYVVHLIGLSSCQKLSADVTGNCEVSAYDASYILRYVVGQIAQFPVGKDWKFFPATFVLDENPCTGIPDSIFYSALSDNKFNQDYKGILFGDVSGNWAGKVVIAGTAKEISVLPKITAKEFTVKPGEEITLPIELSDIGETYSAEFSLGYSADWLQAKTVTTSELTSGFMLEQKISDDQVKIALASAKPVSGSGNFVDITFKVSDKAKNGDRTEIRLQNLRLNESDLMEPNLAYVVSVGAQVPKEFSLSQNHPNPFNPTTCIQYSLPSRSHVVLEVYNLLGQKVTTLVDETEEAGILQAIWNGKDSKGNTVTSGVYFYRIKADNFSEVKKMVLMK